MNSGTGVYIKISKTQIRKAIQKRRKFMVIIIFIRSESFTLCFKSRK